MKNIKMANKGKGFEEEVIVANEVYRQKGLALIQKIATPWQVIRQGKKIISAFPIQKSTLDFRGTVKGGISISFDCKESEDLKGLPLKHIAEHQIDYIREALDVQEISFILCYMKHLDKRFFIKGATVLEKWDLWKENKGKRGFSLIGIDEMTEIKSRNGISLDYLKEII